VLGPHAREDARRRPGRDGRGDADAAEADAAASVDLGVEKVHLRRTDEGRDERVRRARVEVVRRAHLLEDARAHDGEAVGERHRLDLVVRDEDERRLEPPLELHQLHPHLATELRVEVRERLVEEEDGRVPHDRAPERHALALPAGELAGVAGEERLEPQHASRLLHAPLDLRPRHLAHAQGERHVRRDRHVRVEGVVLEDERDVATLRGNVVDTAAVDEHVAAVGGLEAGDHAERGRLAAARGSHEDGEVAVGHAQRDRVDGLRPAAEDLGQLAQLELGHVSPSPRPRGTRRPCSAGTARRGSRSAGSRASTPP
jgi:hypothetical protein